MICYRCQEEIKSGRVQKVINGNVTTSYCRHCFKALYKGKNPGELSTNQKNVIRGI